MIREIQIHERELWDATVKDFENYDVFYLNGYAQAFEDEGEGRPALIYTEWGETRGINVILKRDIAECPFFQGILEKKRYFDLSSPYGYGGFLFKGDPQNFRMILKEYEEYCLERGYISEFVRFELLEPYRKYYNGQTESRTHNIVRNLNGTMEEIYSDFEYKVRKNYRKAKKNGLEIIVDERGERLEDFLRIYYGTMERTEAKEEFFFKKSFFQTLGKMKGNICYFHVLHEGEIISTELVIYGSKNAYSYLGGTDRRYFGVRPNDFLKVEIIKWAKEKGLKNFVLGGGYGKDDGIFKYKKSFAPNGEVDFYIGKRIFDMETYKELCRMRKMDEEIEEGFFPKYRGGGEKVTDLICPSLSITTARLRIKS